MTLSVIFYPYHFVRAILSIPFCPMPCCPYTILSIPFCPYHFVRYHFVRDTEARCGSRKEYLVSVYDVEGCAVVRRNIVSRRPDIFQCRGKNSFCEIAFTV